jgi:2-methylcitrate dehydratase PrpD
MTVACELAKRIVGTRYEQLTPGALRYAGIGLLDTLGVGIAGSREDAAVIARKIAGRTAGAALVWGTTRRAEPLEAAFLNGIAANVLDFDDCTDNLGGHPSAPILPALLALAEERGASGRDVLTAYVTGFETETQLGRGVNFHHYEKGWHPTATLGIFGAGAAGAKLLCLDERRTAHTLALCASMAAGLKSNLGSMGKPLHIGHCSRSGLLAALLAAEGFTGNDDALEHPQGFLEVFNGPGKYSIERILEKWGTPWEIEMPGIAIKQYPCCLSMQAPVDLILKLVCEHDVRPGQVERVLARISQRRLAHTNRPNPRSALDAKLSMQYVLARALTERCVTLEHFEGDAFKAPVTRQAMKLIDAAPFGDDSAHAEMGAQITIVLKDGRRVNGTIDHAVGHEAGQPLAKNLLAAKFAACTKGNLTPQQSEKITGAIADFAALPDVRAFMLLLEPARRSARVAAAK